MSETALQNKIRLAINAPHVRMFRNNIGMLNGVQFGLCKGSSDLIGFTSKTITADDVGKQVAIFTAIEVKTPTGRISKEQANFISLVNRFGGIGAVARSVDDAIQILKDGTK